MQCTVQPGNISVYGSGNPPSSSDCALLAEPILLPAPVGSAELLAWFLLLSFRPRIGTKGSGPKVGGRHQPSKRVRAVPIISPNQETFP